MSRSSMLLKKVKDTVFTLMIRQKLLVVLFFIFIFFSIVSESFFTSRNIAVLLVNSVVIGIAAIGMTFVMIGGGIDLSIGSILLLSSAVGASLMVKGVGSGPGILIIITIGLFLGGINGFLIGKYKMPAFAVTLATMILYQGITLAMTQARTIYKMPSAFRYIGEGEIFGYPISIGVLGIFGIVGHMLLTKTSTGKRIYFVGNGLNIAKLCGINAGVIIFLTYLLSGLCAAVAGIILTARLNSVSVSTGGVTLVFDIVGATVIGGTSIYGGEGTILGSLIGVLLLQTISSGLNLYGVSFSNQMIIKGGLILFAVYLNTLRTMRS